MDDRTSDNYVDSKSKLVGEQQAEALMVSTGPERKSGFERKDVSAVVAELVGCFVFIFMGAGSIVANTWTQGAIGLLGVAAAHGLALAVLITIFGVTSGDILIQL
ncbi:hypothetical protein KDK_76510 [Dictyobacter kobayashii]|uniref:Aquaporin n=1 Tax=Dictyobacter kobayashii TaxID=2014872 RepID=A0A402AXJ6_9CHLR|nr:hypothetical protein KDK_76510 [Dictyobacter kobayashii]